MNITKGRKYLSDAHLKEIDRLEEKLRQSKKASAEIKFTKKDKSNLNSYYKMIDYLGSING